MFINIALLACLHMGMCVCACVCVHWSVGARFFSNNPLPFSCSPVHGAFVFAETHGPVASGDGSPLLFLCACTLTAARSSLLASSTQSPKKKKKKEKEKEKRKIKDKFANVARPPTIEQCHCKSSVFATGHSSTLAFSFPSFFLSSFFFTLSCEQQ